MMMMMMMTIFIFYGRWFLIRFYGNFVGLGMTQFSYSSSDNHLTRSHEKASHILGSDKLKSSHGLNSKVFYGSRPCASVKSHDPISYML
jgi:hypothetical protein